MLVDDFLAEPLELLADLYLEARQQSLRVLLHLVAQRGPQGANLRLDVRADRPRDACPLLRAPRVAILRRRTTKRKREK